MVTSTRTQFLSLVTAGAFVILTAAGIPARSEERLVNLGPVKPYEPILTAVGAKRVVAFFEPNLGHCAVRSVVWDKMDALADTVNSAVQVRAPQATSDHEYRRLRESDDRSSVRSEGRNAHVR